MRDLQYMIDVMTAARDGKLVQCATYGHDDWDNPENRSSAGWKWDWVRFDYRIAPEPRKAREFWIFAGRDGMSATVLKPWSGTETEYIHVREVLPDDES